MQEVSPTKTVQESCTYRYKVILCGPWGVGKTSLVRKYMDTKLSEDYLPTIGATVLIKDICLNVHGEDAHVNLVLWDIAAQDMFKLMRSTFYSGASAGFLVADLARPESFQEILDWAKELRAQLPKIPLVFLANKSDLVRSVDDKYLRDIGDEMGALTVFKTSALNGENVQEAFRYLTEKMIK
jgi:small GTP-binding protein